MIFQDRQRNGSAVHRSAIMDAVLTRFLRKMRDFGLFLRFFGGNDRKIAKNSRKMRDCGVFRAVVASYRAFLRESALTRVLVPFSFRHGI